MPKGIGSGHDEFKKHYCLDSCQKPIDLIRMFKFLLLKATFMLSDVDIVERNKYDMSFKCFLHMADEDSVFESSSLTKI